MESRSVSVQEIRVFQALKAHPGKWLSNHQIAEEALVAERTARAHTARFVEAGIAEVATLFPSNLFRLKDRKDMDDPEFFDQLEHAAEVLSGIADDRPARRRKK